MFRVVCGDAWSCVKALEQLIATSTATGLAGANAAMHWTTVHKTRQLLCCPEGKLIVATKLQASNTKVELAASSWHAAQGLCCCSSYLLVIHMGMFVRYRIVFGPDPHVDQHALCDLHQCHLGQSACPENGSTHWQAGAQW